MRNRWEILGISDEIRQVGLPCYPILVSHFYKYLDAEMSFLGLHKTIIYRRTFNAPKNTTIHRSPETRTCHLDDRKD